MYGANEVSGANGSQGCERVCLAPWGLFIDPMASLYRSVELSRESPRVAGHMWVEVVFEIQKLWISI